MEGHTNREPDGDSFVYVMSGLILLVGIRTLWEGGPFIEDWRFGCTLIVLAGLWSWVAKYEPMNHLRRPCFGTYAGMVLPLLLTVPMFWRWPNEPESWRFAGWMVLIVCALVYKFTRVHRVRPAAPFTAPPSRAVHYVIPGLISLIGVYLLWAENASDRFFGMALIWFGGWIATLMEKPLRREGD